MEFDFQLPQHYPYADNHQHHSCCHCDTPHTYTDTTPAGGFMTENAFMLVNTVPYLFDRFDVKYGTKLGVSENIFTRVTQRKDDSCINLNAVFNMCDSSNTNTVLNHFLNQIIQNKYETIKGILPMMKSVLTFTLFFTIYDSNNMSVYSSSATVYSTDLMYHSTDVVDYFVTSTRNLIIANIPQLEYQGLYTLTLDKIDAYAHKIDTSTHIVDNLNPYYQFTDNNTKIAIQHDIVEAQTSDADILIATCDINNSVNFQASLTTRLRVSFNAFMTNIISVRDTFTVWNSLFEPTDAKLVKLQSDVALLKTDTTALVGDVTQLKTDVDTLETADVAMDTRVDNLEAVPKTVDTYKQGVSYKNGQVVWLMQGKLFQATTDFTSDITEGNTIEQSMLTDISSGHLVVVQTV